MSFHDHLKRLRKAKGLSQEQLALACGWGQSRIANYEAAPTKKSARTPDVDDLPIIAKALGVDVRELFGLPPIASQTARPDPVILDRAVTVLKNLARMQAGEATFLYDAPSILAIYDQVSREPPDLDFDREAVLGRMAAVLRGVSDARVGRGDALGAGGNAVSENGRSS